MIEIDDVYARVHTPENPTNEFKRDWYWENNNKSDEMQKAWGELLKDIISLSNAYIGSIGIDRFLIIGVVDQTREIRGFSHKTISKLLNLNEFRRELISKIENVSDFPPQDIDIESVSIDEKDLLIIKIPQQRKIITLTKELCTKSTIQHAGSVLIRKGQEGDSVRVATPDEIRSIEQEIESHKFNKKEKEIEKERSIISTVRAYIEKNGSYHIENGYPKTEKNWKEKIIFEIYKLKNEISGPITFLYIHSYSSQNKTYGYIKKEKLIKENENLIILTEKPRDVKSVEQRIENLKIRFSTTKVYFINDFGYKFLYGESILSYNPFNTLNYVDGTIYAGNKEKVLAIDCLNEWYLEPSKPLMVVKGYGGIGKTTLVKNFLDHVHRTYENTGIIFIDSNRIIDELYAQSREDYCICDIYDFYSAQTQKEGTPPLTKEILELSVDNGSMLIVLDGIDEVIAKLGNRFDVYKFLYSITHSYAYNLEMAKIIITCRDYFWDLDNNLENISEISLEPFKDEQARLFFSKYFSGDIKKISKSFTLANKFKIKDNEKNNIYVPYVLDLVAYLVSQKEVFDNSLNESSLLDEKIETDFLFMNVCSREVEKLENLDIDEQIKIFVKLSMRDKCEIDDYNLKQIVPENVNDAVINKIRAHPLLVYSNRILKFRYDFFEEFFRVLGIYLFFNEKKIDHFNEYMAETIGTYIRYGNESCVYIAQKEAYSDELMLFLIECIGKTKNADQGVLDNYNVYRSCISAMFIFCLYLRHESENRYDIDTSTKVLTDLFGNGDTLENVNIINVISNRKKIIFNFSGKEIIYSYFNNYEYFWDCQMNSETKFYKSTFLNLPPNGKSLPQSMPKFSECDTVDIDKYINEKIKKEHSEKKQTLRLLKALFKDFHMRGNFYPKAQDIINRKNQYSRVLDILLNNKVIVPHCDPRKATIPQYAVSEEYQGVLKWVEQGTPCAEIGLIMAMFK